MAERHFRDRTAARIDDRGEQTFMFGRIDAVVSAREHGNRATPSEAR